MPEISFTAQAPIKNFWPTRQFLQLAIVFGVSALLVMVWRWGGTVEDSLAYFNTARYLRGEISFAQLQPPFPYRLLVPALAAGLPGDLRNTFALLNWFFIVGSCMALAAAVRARGGSTAGILGAGFLLIGAVPTFWYAPYLLTDPGSIFARSVFVFAFVSGRPALAIASAVLGSAIREENLLLFVWLFATRSAPLRWNVLGVCIAGLWMLLVRWLVLAGLPAYAWVPHVEQIQAAMHDYRSIASILGAVGLVVPLFFYGAWSRAPNSKDFMGLVTLMALPPLYAALCVRVDGRAVWDLYPFMIPIAAGAFERLAKNARFTSRGAVDALDKFHTQQGEM